MRYDLSYIHLVSRTCSLEFSAANIQLAFQCCGVPSQLKASQHLRKVVEHVPLYQYASVSPFKDD